jgi:GTP-binding protein Era
MNQLVGERISIATFKAQTTRHRIMGIVNTPDMQIVFSDTPGVLKPNYKLQESMLAFSESALQDADILLYVTDVVENPEKNMDFLEKVQKMQIPVILLINKIDELASPSPSEGGDVESPKKGRRGSLGNQTPPPSEGLGEALARIVDHWHSLLPNAEILPISAKNKFGVDMLLKRIQQLLPESPAFFDKDQLTDKPARFFVSEIIREKILLYYDKEIPYSVEVVVERFKEDDRQIHINAVIYVERDSQKGIIIGHQGVALKKVSTEARKTLEKFFDKHIYLEIFVKVDKDWRSSKKELDNFGYNPE